MLKRTLIVLLVVGIFVAIFNYYRYITSSENKNELVLYGNVDVRQVDIGFQVAGRVVHMGFEEGDFIHPEVLMGVLDNSIYVDQVRQAEANVTSIKRNLENSEKIYNRRTELIGEGSVSQEDLEQMMTNMDVLKANLAQAEAALSLAKTNLSYTEVFSPTTGTILTRIREPGTVVNVGDPIYTLSIASPVWIRAFVSEPELGLVYPGMKANIHTDTPNGKVYTGKVGFISPVSEFTPKTVETTQLRSDLVYRIRVYADNPDQGLRQGMPVTVRLPLESNQKPVEDQ
jgi:HlyD family secretion protein